MTSLALSLAVSLLCSGLVAPKSDPLREAEAEAEAALRDEQFDEASAALARAYAISKDRKHLFLQAKMERAAGRCAVAVELWESYLDTAPSEKLRDAATRNIEACRDELEPAEPVESASPISTEPDADSPPPPVVVEDTTEPVPPTPKPDALAIGLLVSGALGVAIGGALVGTAYQVNARAPQASSDVAFEDERQRAQRREIAGSVVIGVGAALLVGGAIRFALNRSRRTKTQTALTPRGFSLTARF